jgi:hypothetical protein
VGVLPRGLSAASSGVRAVEVGQMQESSAQAGPLLDSLSHGLFLAAVAEKLAPVEGGGSADGYTMLEPELPRCRRPTGYSLTAHSSPSSSAPRTSASRHPFQSSSTRHLRRSGLRDMHPTTRGHWPFAPAARVATLRYFAKGPVIWIATNNRGLAFSD